MYVCIYIYIKYIVYVWIALKIGCVWCLHFFPRSYALFMGPANMKKKKSIFKTGSHDTIYIFKNYFVTVFSVINFQFSVISVIQILSIVFSV